MLEVTLPTMTCGHCVRTVTETVQRIDPAARLNIDLPSQKVSIDSGAPAQQFIDALTEEGYPPAPSPRG
jgi:copper chaperone